MKKPHVLIGLLAALGTAIGVIVAIVGLPYGRLNYTAFAGLYHGGTAFVSVQVELDCDTTTAGIQTSCNIPLPASGNRTIGVVLSNWSGTAKTIGAFNWDLYNPTCGGAGAPSHPQGTLSVSGCVSPPLPKGIWPNSIPNIAGASVGYPILLNPQWAPSCGTGGDYGDAASGGPNTSTSFLSCFSSGGDVLAQGASVMIGTQSYTMDVTAPTTIPLTLSNVSVANTAAVTLVACDPISPPPAAPGGTNKVSGPCFNAVLNFVPPPSPTPVTPTNTPVPATATNTPLPTNTATNTPIPPSATPTPAGAIQFKECDPAANPNNTGPGPTCNLFICVTPPAGVGTCTGPGEGHLIVLEKVTNVQTVGNVGIGAYEFQVEFDSFVIQSVNPSDVVFSPGGAGASRGPANCSMSIVSENSVRFGCVTKGSTPLGPNGSFTLAKLDLVPAADDVKDMRPGNENGIPTLIKDNGCELADIFGHPVLGTVGGAGQLKQCGDIFVTIRILEGDMNLDCKVDVLDEALIAQHFGAFFGSALFQKWFDLEPRFGDLDVDIKDVQKVFGRDGSTCQNPIPAQTPVAPPAGWNLAL